MSGFDGRLAALLRSLAPAVPTDELDDAVKIVSAVLFNEQDLLARLVRVAQHAAGSQQDATAVQLQLLWVITAALSHAFACEPPQSAAPLLDSAAACSYLPLLRRCAAQPQLPCLAVQRHLAAAVCACGRWDVACALVQAAVGWAEGAGGGGGGAGAPAVGAWERAILELPVSNRIQLAAIMVETALDASGLGEGAGAASASWEGHDGSSASAGSLVALAAGEAFTATLAMLERADLDPAAQQALARRLLPAGLRASERLGRLQECRSGLLGTCRVLIAGGQQEGRRVGLALVVQFAPQLLLPLPGQAPLLGEPGQWLAGDAAEGGPLPLWQLLRDCLLDAEALNRKRAAHVLKAALLAGNAPGGRLLSPWDSFFQLLDTLDEFSPHLVQDSWPEIDKLHPPKTAVVPPCKLARSGSQSRGAGEQPAAAAGAESAPPPERSRGQPALSFAWMRVLWLRGLAHGNPQVRRLVMASLVERDWEFEAYLCSVPAAFLGSDVAQALGQSIAHKPVEGLVVSGAAPSSGGSAGSAGSTRAERHTSSTGVGGGSGNGQPELSPLAAKAVALVRRYSRAAGPRRRRELLLCLLHLLAEREPPRLLLHTAVEMLRAVGEEEEAAGTIIASGAVAAAEAAGADGSSGAGKRQGEEGWAPEVVGLLQRGCSNLRSFGTSSFVLWAYSGLIQVASSVLDIRRPADMLLLGQWAADFHLALLQPEAPLHAHFQGLIASSCADQAPTLLSALVKSFFSSPGPPSTTSGPLSGAELVAWRLQAGAIARLALLAAQPQSSADAPRDGAEPSPVAALGEPAAGGREGVLVGLHGRVLAEAFGPLATNLGVMYRRPYISRGTAERSLALLHALLEVCTATGAATRSPQPPTLLQLWVARVATGCCEELCSYAGMKSQALWVAANRHSMPTGSSLAATQRGGEMGPEAAIDLAKLAVGCMAGALTLLARSQQEQHADCAEAGTLGLAAQRYSLALLHGLRDFACYHAHLGSSGPGQRADTSGAISSVDGSGSAHGGQEHADTSGAHGEQQGAGLALAQATAQLECVSVCLEALQASQQQLQEGSRGLGGPAPHLQNLLALLLALQHAGSGTAGAKYELWWWRCVDGVLTMMCGGLAQQATLPQLHGSQRATLAVGEPPCEDALGNKEAGQLLRLAAAGLGTAHRSCLVPMLRCIRLLLPLAARQPCVPRHALPESSEPASLASLLRLIYNTAWAACNGTMRRSTGLTAAFVSTCLHQVLFDIEDPQDSRLADLHGAGGPVRQLVDDLVAAGERSARLMTLAALQLCGLWGWRPVAALPYLDVLQAVCLYGPRGEGPGGQEGEVVTDAESADELAAVMRPTDPQLAKAFAATPIAPRVAMLCLLHQWAASAAAGEESSAGQQWVEQGGGAAAAAAGAAAAQEMWARLLQLATTDKELSSSKYVLNGPTHRRKVRLWQALCVVSPAVTAQQAPAAMDALLGLLAAANAASVKQYQEAATVQVLRRDPSLFESKVMAMLRDYDSRSDAPVSLVLVGAKVLLASLHAASGDTSGGSGTEQKLDPAVLEYARTLAGWTMSHVHATRTFAQLVLWRLLELCPALARSDPSLAAMLDFFCRNFEARRLRAGLGPGLDSLDLSAVGTSPRLVLSQARWPVRQGAGAGGVLEGAPMPLLDQIQGFLLEARAQLRRDAAAEQVEFGRAELSRSPAVAVSSAGIQQRQQQAQGERRGSEEGQQHQPPGLHQLPAQQFWQRKITTLEQSLALHDPWGAVLGIPALASGRRDEFEQVVAGAAAEASQQAGPARQDIMVVATLVSRVPNLAGLCRTCEVFRAGCLVLADASVTKDPSFASISVTAEQHIPIAEVPEAALLPWLERQSSRGYCLVGLEQTAESTRLQDFCFPTKSVLVLGREKEGLPADVLGLLHHTVEIPQLGLIRSLNVHVSGAIALYEATRQTLATGRQWGGA